MRENNLLLSPEMSSQKPDYPIANFETQTRTVTYTRTVDVIVSWTHLCPFCEDEFTAKRVDAIYCSPSCRHAAFRKRRRQSESTPSDAPE